MSDQPSMLKDAVVKAERLAAHLDLEAAAMQFPAASSSSRSSATMMDGEHVIKTAADCARRLVHALHRSADNQAKS